MKENNNTYTFTNINGYTIGLGDVVYYIEMNKSNLNILTRKTLVRSIIIEKDKISIMSNLKMININDVYGTELECKEVIERWRNEILKKRIREEINNSLATQRLLTNTT